MRTNVFETTCGYTALVNPLGQVGVSEDKNGEWTVRAIEHNRSGVDLTFSRNDLIKFAEAILMKTSKKYRDMTGIENEAG